MFKSAHISNKSSSGNEIKVADFAKPIAYSKEDKELHLFECNSEQFIALILAWAENSLYYNPDTTISEIFCMLFTFDYIGSS